MALIILMAAAFSMEAGPYHVVIGSFSNAGQGREFTTSVKNVFKDASLLFDPGSKLHHISVAQSNHLEEAERMRAGLRAKGFAYAWVYRDATGGPVASAGTRSSHDYVTLELYTGASVLLSSADRGHMSISKDREAIRKSTLERTGFAFTFVAEAQSGRSISASVTLLDKKGAAVSSFKTGEMIAFGGRDTSHLLTLVCEAPGFNQETRIIDLSNFKHAHDLSQDSAGVWKVRFRMTGRKVDEVPFIFTGLFDSNSAILQPRAKDQLDVLLAWLQSQGSAKIVINTHCNPGGRREVRVPEGEDTIFDEARAILRQGTDKQLTRARAETLRSYIAGSGIDASRISIMGWGSLSLLTDELGKNAHVNERVAIEWVDASR